MLRECNDHEEPTILTCERDEMKLVALTPALALANGRPSLTPRVR
jgi:hypothetical protein